ncbi:MULTISPECIES: hypothetical protein [unclassified Flavobacterium]|uniref:hypothetical protein n=1 Tax=unclassified Flavobacterium TaxID=196869 RepID=UPI0012915BEF|nr:MULTISPECIES: hypothetical protein [unclassified Flavobacterium]MQP53293.1 hypothetical protein [Flavobacterium sp. LMO9]MQP63304.1 hypothetical protein [Flavobacterium sp. LMO6]
MINEQDKIRAEKICIHEAGHLIASKLLGFKTNGISIKIYPTIGHSGEATIILPTPEITNNDKLIEYLEKRVQILYAGVIAQFTDIDKNFDNENALKEWRNGGGMVDYAKVRELTHILRNIKYPTTSEEDEQQLELDKLDQVNFANSVKIVFENIIEIHRIGKLLSYKVLQYDITYTLTEDELL